MSGCHFANAEPPPRSRAERSCYFRKVCRTPRGELLSWAWPEEDLGDRSQLLVLLHKVQTLLWPSPNACSHLPHH